jgi:hypothetical protein
VQEVNIRGKLINIASLARTGSQDRARLFIDEGDGGRRLQDYCWTCASRW